MSFRKIIFWLHLIAGIVAGVVILIMCLTGAALAFEKEIIAWAERDARRVTPPSADAKPLALDELLARVRESKPGERPSAVTLDADPGIAVLASFGRTNSVYVNPYTGEVRNPSSRGMRSFMQTMLTWHRYLSAGEQRRPLGKAITGACNAGFLFLAVGGFYLWWPRQWTKPALRSVTLMNFKLRGKARDWNWHNCIGFWCAPVLIVLTATAMPISYPWASNLIYKITRTTPPAPGGPGAISASLANIPPPPTGTKPLGLSELFAVAQKEFPEWKQISQRAAGPSGRGQRPEGSSRSSAGSTNAESPEARPEGALAPSERRSEDRRTIPPTVTLTITEQGQWPLFASTQLTLDPFTGAVLRKEGFRDFNLGRRVRSWTRFLHTGEALGFAGKAVAGLASAASALLVWTGFAMAWRRFFSRDSGSDIPPPAGDAPLASSTSRTAL